MTELVRILRKNICEAVRAGNSWVEVSLEALNEAIELIEYQEAVIGHYEMNEARLTAPVKKIRAEAIKKFARIVKENMTDGYGDWGRIIYEDNFDYLVKETIDESHS